ncbi:MAG: hypothetical protein J3K34DRAFT_430310 [Monoraphidium minutum]|nr:MAG: hypothetical protein J3K34DRAFT_430310 [Monoraphidium minutum]
MTAIRVLGALCCALLLAPGANAAASSADGLIGKGKMGGLAGNGKAFAAASALATPMGKAASFPPAPSDFAPGVCTGYPFCVPGVIPPTLAAPAVSCPDGFQMKDDGRCCAEEPVCMWGTQLAQGKCCAERASTTCFASLEGCPGDCSTAGTICAPSPAYTKVAAHVQVEAAANPSYKEAADGKAWFKLLLPMFDVGKGALIAGAKAAVESKLVGVSTLGKGKGWGKGKGSWAKAEVVPQCFSKCCRQNVEVQCVEPRVKTLTAPVIVSCPPGCSGPVGSSCVCEPGGPAPCPPGTRECPSFKGRICVSDSLCYGIDHCKLANLLLPQLGPISCPAVRGGGGGGGAAAAAAASAGAR